MPSDNANSGRYRYSQMDIHLCEHCHDAFEEGDRVVGLSDGRTIRNEYHVTNRRFFHFACWADYRSQHTGSSRE